MKEKIAVIASIIILMGTAFSVHFYFENRYALAQQLQDTDRKVDKTIQMMDQKMEKTNQIMDYKFKSLQSENLQERIWKIEDRYGKDPKDPVIKETLRKLYVDKEKVDRELKALEKK